jgi:hypothetical protein
VRVALLRIAPRHTHSVPLRACLANVNSASRYIKDLLYGEDPSVKMQFPGSLEVEKIPVNWWQQTMHEAPVDTLEVCPSVGEDARSSVITSEGFLQCMPHMHGCDGAFAARIRVVDALV